MAETPDRTSDTYVKIFCAVVAAKAGAGPARHDQLTDDVICLTDRLVAKLHEKSEAPQSEEPEAPPPSGPSDSSGAPKVPPGATPPPAPEPKTP